MSPAAPSLRVEKRLLRSGHEVVAAVDEVGRGALAGPASAGVVLVDSSVARPLRGVHDSKLLTPQARRALVPRIERWAVASAVGHASAAEVDRFGLTAALRLAGHRALAQLPIAADVVLLDGNHDWLSPPGQSSLFAPEHVGDGWPEAVVVPPVVTMIKADMSCAAVAAASVLAKVARDALMMSLAVEHPDYGWDENKGYATPAHLEALRRVGASAEHRRSWRLPGVVANDGRGDAVDAVDAAAARPHAELVIDLTDPFGRRSEDPAVAPGR